MVDVPNVLIGKEPHNEFLTSVNYPNMWSLNRKQPGGKQKKKKEGGSNLMDTGPDDANPFVQAAEADKNTSVGSDSVANAIAQGWQGSPQSGQQNVADYGGGAVNPFTGNPVVGGQEQGAYGFRDKSQDLAPSIAATPGQTPVVPEQAAVPPQVQSNLMDSGPDDNYDSRPAVHRDEFGNVYQVGSAADPYASTRPGGLPFSLPSAEDMPFPGVTGAILGGVSGLSNRNLDNIQEQSAMSPGHPAYDDRYSYGELGNQRFGTSPGLIPGSTVVSGPSELRGLGVNTTVENTAANQQKLLAEAQKDTYQSASGNTYVGQTASNKREADEEARDRGYGSAVTDSSGKAVRDQKGTVVTSGQKIQNQTPATSDDSGGNDNDSGGGK